MILPMTNEARLDQWDQGQKGNKCILRLIPGIDLLIPDRRLVGGMDADQMVFQARVRADVTGIPPVQRPYLSLWLMFEYAGVLTIEPVHASIDMIPIKSMPPLQVPDTIASPAVEKAEGGGEGTNPTGAGIFDFLQKIPVVGDVVSAVKAGLNSGFGRGALKFLGNNFLDQPLTLGPPQEKGGRIAGGTIVGAGQLSKYFA